MRIFSFILFGVFTVLFGVRASWAFWEYRVDIKQSYTHFFFDRDQHDVNAFLDTELLIDLLYNNEKNFKVFLQPRLQIDAFDSERLRYIPNQAYIDFYGKNFSWKTGLQRVAFGYAEFFHPTDVINRQDFGRHYFSPESLGELVSDFSYTVDQVGPLKEWKFQFLAMPFFQKTPLPHEGSRFYIEGEAGGIGYELGSQQETPDFLDGVGFAVTSSAKIKQAEVQVIYYHGPERHPGFQLDINNDGQLNLLPFYYGIDMLGLNFRLNVGSVLFKFEGAYKNTSGNGFRAHDLTALSQNAIPGSYFQLVSGLEYTITEVFKKGEVQLFFEYLGDVGQDSDAAFLQSFRPFQNDVMFGLFYRLGNSRDTTIKLGVVKDLSHSEFVVFGELTSKLYKQLSGGVKTMWVNKEATGTAFSYFDHNSHASVFLSYTFGKRFDTEAKPK